MRELWCSWAADVAKSIGESLPIHRALLPKYFSRGDYKKRISFSSQSAHDLRAGTTSEGVRDHAI